MTYWVFNADQLAEAIDDYKEDLIGEGESAQNADLHGAKLAIFLHSSAAKKNRLIKEAQTNANQTGK